MRKGAQAWKTRRNNGTADVFRMTPWTGGQVRSGHQSSLPAGDRSPPTWGASREDNLYTWDEPLDSCMSGDDPLDLCMSGRFNYWEGTWEQPLGRGCYPRGFKFWGAPGNLWRHLFNPKTHRDAGSKQWNLRSSIPQTVIRERHATIWLSF